jgi:hypothetical protein
MNILLQATLLLASLAAPTAALPTGAAGTCPEAIAAVGGFHLSRNPGDLGSITDGGLTITIDDIPLDSAVPLDLVINEDHTIALSGSFRGFLFRLASPLDSGLNAVPNIDFLAPEAGNGDVQLSDICNNLDVAGVTHVINDIKTAVSATINADMVYEGLFDVTVSISYLLTHITCRASINANSYLVCSMSNSFANLLFVNVATLLSLHFRL